MDIILRKAQFIVFGVPPLSNIVQTEVLGPKNKSSLSESEPVLERCISLIFCEVPAVVVENGA